MYFLLFFNSIGVPLYHDTQNSWNRLIRVKLYETILIGNKIMAEKNHVFSYKLGVISIRIARNQN